MSEPLTATSSTLAQRLAAVRAEIAAACSRAGRPADSVTLVAVSKTHPPEVVLEAVAAGQLDFGENRVEEAVPKMAAVGQLSSAPLRWHMIGHVQSRKAQEIVHHFEMVHSLDSVKLAERYARFSAERSQPLKALLEVNISGEESKAGFAAQRWQSDAAQRETLWADIRRILQLPMLEVGGLMTMAPIVDDPEQTRPVFAALRQLRDALQNDFPDGIWSQLSMGMTDDYPIAIEEGATIVRIGRAIFGERR
jgi:pyridoxal phosphate enzyme (YggS family)